MATNTKKETTGIIDELFKAGAHFGFIKSRRHPSVKPFLFGTKDKIEIFNLEKTSGELESITKFIEEKGKEKATILFVGGKNEARAAAQRAGEALDMPYVSGRWIGGTLTNFPEIKKRLARLDELSTQKEKGELGKYTKKERLLIDREIDKLELYFGGITGMKSIPKIMVVIDPKKEHIAVAEAKRLKIPVVALAGSDCDINSVEYALPANDSSRQSIALFMEKIVEAYKKGLTEAKDTSDTKEPK